MRLGIATRDWSPITNPPSLGGSGYYRCGLVAKVLEGLGHDVVLGTLCARDRPTSELGVVTWDNEQHWGFDVMLLQRWMFADLPDRMRRARANGQIILSDVDDWWEGLDPANQAWWTSSQDVNPTENREHYRRTLAASDALVCSTPFLAERYRRLNPRTILIRNCLDLERWMPNQQEPRDGPPVLGWVGAIPWRSQGDLEALSGFLGPFLRKHDLRFHHAGAMVPGWDFALATRMDPWRLDQSPLVPITGHERQFEGIDIMLVPLADKPFNAAKSNLKTLQAAAAGVPVISSAMPEQRWLRDECRIGRTAKNPRQWINHLEALMCQSVREMDVLRNNAGVMGFGLHTLAAQWKVLLSSIPVGAAA